MRCPQRAIRSVQEYVGRPCGSLDRVSSRTVSTLVAVPRARLVPILAAERRLEAIHQDRVHVTFVTGVISRPRYTPRCSHIWLDQRVMSPVSRSTRRWQRRLHNTGHAGGIRPSRGGGRDGGAGDPRPLRPDHRDRATTLHLAMLVGGAPSARTGQVPLRMDVLRLGVSLVVTFHRQPDGLVSVACTGGQFMTFRAPGTTDAPDQPWPMLGAWALGTGRANISKIVSGPAFDSLPKASRGNVMAQLLNRREQRLLAIADGAACTLLCALAGPRSRLMVEREQGSEGIGLLDPGRQGFAVLLSYPSTKTGGARMALRSCGDGHRAVEELLALVEGCRALVRPL